MDALYSELDAFDYWRLCDQLSVAQAALLLIGKDPTDLQFSVRSSGKPPIGFAALSDGPTVFAHACKLGLEGIVSKWKDSAYRSGRSPDWLKMKNSDAPAVKREAEEDWGR
jgi:hypothetical protein